MSTAKNMPPCTSRYYQITVEGQIDISWSDWLEGSLLVSSKEADGMPVTVLSVLIDQAALRGLLNRLWDLNLILCCVQRIDPATITTIE